jgi:hypothetical protein
MTAPNLVSGVNPFPSPPTSLFPRKRGSTHGAAFIANGRVGSELEDPTAMRRATSFVRQDIEASI